MPPYLPYGFLTLGILLTSVGLIIRQRLLQRIEGFVPSGGILKKFQSGRNGLKNLVVEYRVGKRPYSTWSHCSHNVGMFSRLKIGTELPVRYDPDEPSRAVLMYDYLSMPQTFFGLGGGFLFLGLVFLIEAF